MSKIASEMKALEDSIRHHQYLYYVKNKPEISDKEFDLLFKKLQTLEEKHPDLASSNSPTRIIGSDLDNRFEKFTHKIPVLSLDNTYNATELKEWLQKIGEDHIYSLEWKIDGASIVLYYEEGELTRGVSRGSGGIGDDVTDNIRTVKNIPLSLPEKLTIYLRGEVYMTFSDFAAFNKKAGGKYANPRNLAAGTLKHKSSREVAQRPLKIFTYDAYFPQGVQEISSHQEILQLMTANKFPVPQDIRFARGKDIPDLLVQFEATKQNLDFPVDGLVVKLNELNLRKSLGDTSHSPRWARAFKFDALTAQSKIEQIDFAIGRTGKITPRAKITPVQLAGTTVTYATLHNQDYINSKGIGIDALVTVVKRGEIIPAIENVVRKGKSVFQLPGQCPDCQSKLSKKDDSVDLFCTNRNCPSRQKNQLVFFCEKKQMNIDGLGEKQIYNLYEKGFIKQVVDIYQLHTQRDKLIELEGYGEKSVKILLDGIEKSKKNDLKTLLPSLGLPEVGHKVTEILLDNGYTDIDKIIQLTQQPDAEEILLEVHGLGPRTVESIIHQFQDTRVIQTIQQLKQAGLNFHYQTKKATGKQVFQNQSWCVTGSFQRFQPRDRAVEYIINHGGKKVSSVSSKTTHLLAGEKAGSKLKQAEKLGVQVVNEEEFYNLLVKEGIL